MYIKGAVILVSLGLAVSDKSPDIKAGTASKDSYENGVGTSFTVPPLCTNTPCGGAEMLHVFESIIDAAPSGTDIKASKARAGGRARLHALHDHRRKAHLRPEDNLHALAHLREPRLQKTDQRTERGGAESGTKREVPGAGGEPNAKRFCAGAGATQPGV